jgi:hypothetical protein
MDLQAKLLNAYICLASNLGYWKCNRVNFQGDIPVLLSFIWTNLFGKGSFIY